MAFRGCVALLGKATSKSDIEIVIMLEKAMDATPNSGEKRKVLSTLASLNTKAALVMAVKYLNDDYLRGEAEIATVNIASKLAASDPETVKTILEDVILQTSNIRLSKQAQEIIDKIKINYGKILVWQMAGPYTKKPLFETAYQPEKNAKEVDWKLVHADPAAKDPFVFDLGKLIGGNDKVAYLRTYIFSDQDQKAELLIGSDDGVIAWLNSKVVHSNNAARPVAIDQDKVQIDLKKGQNELMLKVVQLSGNWGACARIRKPGGGAIEGIKFATDK
jgi:hypothetical protein